MAGSAEVVEEYFDAWTSKDFEKARSLLHDDLSFKGPIETLDSADALMGSVKGLAQIVTELGAPRGPAVIRQRGVPVIRTVVNPLA